MRWLALLLCFAACKKSSSDLVGDNTKKPADAQNADRVGGTPEKAHKYDDPDPRTDAFVAEATDAAEIAADAHQVGGDGTAAAMDGDGHPHGPGGPVYMGRGVDCDAAHDHCMRPGVWFQADNVVSGKLFRALPVYELDGAWYDWGNGEKRTGKFFKTKLATVDSVRVGDTIVFFNTPQPPQWANTEYDAMTSSNWEIGVVDSVNSSNKSFRVKGWSDYFSIDAGRAVTEQK